MRRGDRRHVSHLSWARAHELGARAATPAVLSFSGLLRLLRRSGSWPPAAPWCCAFAAGCPSGSAPHRGGGRETQRASWPFTRARQLPALARLRRPCKGLVPLLWLWTDLIGAVSPREGSAGPSPRGQRPEGRTTPPFASARLLCSAALVGVGALRWPRPVPRAAYLERRQVVVVIDGSRLWVRRRHLGGRGAARARVEAPQATGLEHSGSESACLTPVLAKPTTAGLLALAPMVPPAARVPWGA